MMLGCWGQCVGLDVSICTILELWTIEKHASNVWTIELWIDIDFVLWATLEFVVLKLVVFKLGY